MLWGNGAALQRFAGVMGEIGGVKATSDVGAISGHIGLELGVSGGSYSGIKNGVGRVVVCLNGCRIRLSFSAGLEHPAIP